MSTKPSIPPGYGQRLDIDLSNGRVTRKDLDPQFAREFVGGMGFSLKILFDEVSPEVDPLSPQNVIIIANGVLTGTNAPCAARTEISTRHPLTGHLGSGNTGGSWGTMLKRAGFDIVTIRGEAKSPVYLWISDHACEIKDASHLWGQDTYETFGTLEKELGPNAKVLAIGPAGENLVRFACPINEYHHCAGRSGAGAVMGAKKLKAIAAYGTGSPLAARPEAFKQAVNRARQRIHQFEVAKGAPRDAVVEAMATGSLPCRNYQTGVMPHALKNGWRAAMKPYITADSGTCHACPMSCFKGVAVKTGKYAGVTGSRGSHPSVLWDFGAKCGIGIDNLPAQWKSKELCHRFGLDYCSTAGVIAFTQELFQRGLITTQDTGGLDLAWGNEDAVIQLIQKLALRDGFGDLLAEGSVRMAQKIGKGAEKYVMAVKGIEMKSFDPRTYRRGYVFGEITGPRGDNLKSTHFLADQYEAGWWVDKFDMPENMKNTVYSMPPDEVKSTWEGKPLLTKWFEDLTSLQNALGTCFFPANFSLALGPTYFAELLSAFTGWDFTADDAMKLGEKVFTLLKVNIMRDGLTRKDDTWPDRFFTEALPEGPTRGARLSREEMDRLLDEYYELRGWDKKTGLPTEGKLIALGLGDIAREIRKPGKLPGK